jgi:pimeloyl-ACP methyl ester carboxylesterase
MKPFTVAVGDQVLEDLSKRLARTRWPDQVEGADWDYGTELSYLRGLVDYWLTGFDWRRQEGVLNQLPQFRAKIDGLDIHFVYIRGTGPASFPLILTHGWPSSFFEMYKIVWGLADPAGHGGDPTDAFDVIVPSLPGFGFSERPMRRGYLPVDLEWPQPLPEKETLSDAERDYLERVKRWEREEGAYGDIQATRPQSLAYGLNDSPAGLAAWIVEKFRAWSDCGGDPESRFTKDELLTNVMIYWTTQTINSSMRKYFESRHNPTPNPLKLGERIEVPTGIAMFPGEKDLVVPREWAERCYNIQRWTDMPRGGHFPALEEPDLLVQEIRAFFRGLRPIR